MINKLRKWEEHLNPDHIRIGNGSSVEIIETETSGAGLVKFTVNGDYIFVKGRAGDHQIIWLKSKCCADGGVITFDEGRICMHIIELKSTVRKKEWEKAQKQFAGMLLNLLAILGCAGTTENIDVKCYLVYKKDALNNARDTSPIFDKALPELALPKSGYEGWNDTTIELPFKITAGFSKHLRNSKGNAHI